MTVLNWVQLGGSVAPVLALVGALRWMLREAVRTNDAVLKSCQDHLAKLDEGLDRSEARQKATERDLEESRVKLAAKSADLSTESVQNRLLRRQLMEQTAAYAKERTRAHKLQSVLEVLVQRNAELEQRATRSLDDQMQLELGSVPRASSSESV